MFIAPYALLRQMPPLLLETKGQVIVNSSRALRATAGLGQYAATKDAMKAIADPTTRSQCGWRRRHGAFLGRSASERQRAIFAAKGRPYPPDRLIQPPDVAGLVRFLLLLPRTTEVTDIVMRPMLKT